MWLIYRTSFGGGRKCLAHMFVTIVTVPQVPSNHLLHTRTHSQGQLLKPNNLYFKDCSLVQEQVGQDVYNGSLLFVISTQSQAQASTIQQSLHQVCRSTPKGQREGGSGLDVCPCDKKPVLAMGHGRWVKFYKGFIV